MIFEIRIKVGFIRYSRAQLTTTALTGSTITTRTRAPSWRACQTRSPALRITTTERKIVLEKVFVHYFNFISARSYKCVKIPSLGGGLLVLEIDS